MAKKAGRSARALQAEAQRLGVSGKASPGPLINLEKTTLTGNEVEELVRPARKTQVVDETVYVEPSTTATASGTVNLPRRNTYARRSSTIQPAKSVGLSREEEYAFIRADLVAVALLTLLIIVALVVLTFIVR
jgi:hypothetical protein